MITLFKSLFKKEYILFKRYFLNSIGALISLCIIFTMIFLGYKGISMGNVNFGSNFEGIMVGYVLWFFGFTAYSTITDKISIESSSGTLEQLYMSAFSFRTVLFMTTISSCLFNLISVGILFIFSMFITGNWLNVDLISLTPVIIFTILCFYGLGLISGGITLIFKKAGGILQIIQIAILAFIAAPVDKFVGFALLPGSLGANMIQEILRNGKHLSEFSINTIFCLVLIGIIYIALGSIVYKICQEKAMKEGNLGHY